MSKRSFHAKWLTAAMLGAVGGTLLAIPAFAAPGDVTTLAGSGVAGFVNAAGASALFNTPEKLAVDSAGNVFVSDGLNHVVRRVTSAGVVTTFVGSGAIGSLIDGTGTSAGVYGPGAMTFDSSGTLYLISQRKIRTVTPLGVVTTLAGSGGTGSVNGPAASATFVSPSGIAVNSAGDVFVADSGSQLIRKISGGMVSTFAGSGANLTVDGAGAAASFATPTGIVFDPAGNLFVAEIQGQNVRKIDPSGNVTTFVSLPILSFPTGIAISSNGNLYLAMQNTKLVVQVTSAGVVTTIAGLYFVKSYVDGSNSVATFGRPFDVAVFGSTLYVADRDNHAIRQIDISGVVPPAGPTSTSTTTSSPSTSASTSTSTSTSPSTSTSTSTTSTLPSATTTTISTLAPATTTSAATTVLPTTTRPIEFVYLAIPSVTTTSSPAFTVSTPTVTSVSVAIPPASPSSTPPLTVASILASSSVPASPAPANVQGDTTVATPAYTGSSNSALLFAGLLALALGALALASSSMIRISTCQSREEE